MVQSSHPDSDVTAVKLEDRKLVERDAYDLLYAREAPFANPNVREGLLHASENHFCTRLKALSAGARVLEIGCGAGDHALLAAASGAACVEAIDISSAGIDLAKRKASSSPWGNVISYSVMDAEQMQFPSNHFDLILDHEVFSSLELARLLPELRRVLKPGGTLLGQECLADNFVFNLNRRIKAFLGTRTVWAVQHVLTQKDFETLRRHFPDVACRHFHLIHPFVWPVRFLPGTLCTRAREAVDRMDAWLLLHPPLQRYAFKAVFEAR